MRAYLALLWLATLAQATHLKPCVPCGAMRWGPQVLNSPACREGRWHFLRLAGIGIAARAARARGPCSWVPRGSVSCTAVRTLSWMPIYREREKEREREREI